MKGITVTLTKEQKYKKIGKLGEGMFGAVEKAENQKTGEIVAIKEMNLSLFNSKPRLVEMLKSEIKALTTIRHPNLLHLLDHFTKQ
jgi:serine/threonine protein kinase